MNENCPICGCKTEEFDFVDIDTQSGVLKVCDYCGKQINVLQAADVKDAESLEKIKPKLRWLDAAIEKDEESRGEAYEKELIRLQSKFPKDIVQLEPEIGKGSLAPIGAGESFEADNNRITQLERKIESLEAEFHKYKRKMIIRSIAELVVPAIILSIVAIIFFKSDLWADLSSIIHSATGGYSLF